MAAKKTRSKHKNKAFYSRHPRLMKWVGIPLGVVTGLTLIIVIIAQFSVWPSALAIRWLFEQTGKESTKNMQSYVPAGVSGTLNQQYRNGDKDAYLDVYYPDSVKTSNAKLPTIVWIHGGAWVAGSKENVAPYAKILASHGYTVAAIDYSLAPEHHYPLPLTQANDAMTYLKTNADKFHINTEKFVLAGDSAGSQIASQEAAVITNPRYAQTLGVTPAISAPQLAGTILNCGAYNAGIINSNGLGGIFLGSVLWAYSGTKDFMHNKAFQTASVENYVTGAYPQTFMTVGNADPLEPQSRSFAAKLNGLGVPITTLFYPPDHQPKLPHEYQFHLSDKDAQNALSQIVSFLGTATQ